MLKFAALAAVVNASWRDEIEQENAVEMWKYTVHEKELQGLEKHAKALQTESETFQTWYTGKYQQVFEKDYQALVNTDEYVALAKYVVAMRKKGPTPQIKAFRAKYIQQLHKVEMAHKKMEMNAQKNAKVWGDNGNHHMTVDVDNDEWYEFNTEYYELREMQYDAMHDIPEIAKLREHIHALQYTQEFKNFQKDWYYFTQQKEVHSLVSHQHIFVKEAIKTIHMTDADKKWMDPHYSPVMFDVWHTVYIYLVAMRGDLNPMLDFMIDGEYNEQFEDSVDPDFGRPEENLYLF